MLHDINICQRCPAFFLVRAYIAVVSSTSSESTEGIICICESAFARHGQWPWLEGKFKNTHRVAHRKVDGGWSQITVTFYSLSLYGLTWKAMAITSLCDVYVICMNVPK